MLISNLQALFDEHDALLIDEDSRKVLMRQPGIYCMAFLSGWTYRVRDSLKIDKGRRLAQLHMELWDMRFHWSEFSRFNHQEAA